MARVPVVAALTAVSSLPVFGKDVVNPSAASGSADTTRVVMLGTGTPNADPDRSGPAVAVVTGGRPYLVDCGPGVVRRAAAAHRQGVEALAVENLAIVFLTHLHSDHTVGCADLLLTPWTLEREVPLRVYGPPGAKAMFDNLMSAYREDVRIRIDGLEPSNETGHLAEVVEILPGEVYRDERVRVEAIAVEHGAWPHAFGYRFETPDRTIVISGDTGPTEAIVEHCAGCDILVHEVFSDSGYARREPAWQRYHASSHTSAADLGKLASRAAPGLLVLYHQLFWGTSEEDLVEEVRGEYDGTVVSAQDLDVF